MKITKTFFTAFAVSALLVSGCGAFETKKKGRKAEQIDSGLTGTWQSGCFKGDWLGLSQSSESYAFSAIGDFDKGTVLYTDECKTPSAVLTIRGTYDELGAALVDGAKNINFTVREVGLTPRTEDFTKMLNTTYYCGVNNWKVNESTSIMGRDCLGEDYSDGEVVFDIYRLQDDNLVFGKSMIWFDKSDADDRPKELNLDRTFRK